MKTKSYFQYIKQRYKTKNYLSYFIITFVTILFSILSFADLLDRSSYILLEQVGYSIVIALSLSLVIGFLGELSLGHGGFMSIGAYVGGFFQTYVFKDLLSFSPLLSIIIAMIIGGIAASIFGFLIGLPTLRLKGDYLAITTLAFGEIIKIIIQNTEFLGGNKGLKTYRYNNKTLFIIIFIVVLITVVVIQNFIKSKQGRAVMAIRDNEIAAKAMGVNVTYYKLLVFVISSFFAGVSGVLLSNTQYSIESTAFDYNYSINVLVMVVLGGMGNLNGTMISAGLIAFINIKLSSILTGNLAALQKIFYSLILICIVIYNNAPKLKTFRSKYSLKKYFDRLYEKLYTLFTKKPFNKGMTSDKDYGADWSKVPTKIEMNELLSTNLNVGENSRDSIFKEEQE